jgi:hypothetical protein
MIRYFSVENYKNFKDVSVIEFDLHGQDKKPINTLAIYGDTFSGKSDLLEALILCIRYLADMKRNVQNPPKNITYNIPVKFHLILDIHGVEVTYQLQIAKTTDTTYSITKELYVGDVEIDTEHILEYHLSEMPIINRTFEFTQGVYVNTMIERYLPTKKSFLDNLQNFTHTARIVPSEIISQIQDFDWDFLSCKEKEVIC